jgi:hypothetical protein
MRAGVQRVSKSAAAVTAWLLVLAMGCSDGSGITAPLPAVEGSVQGEFSGDLLTAIQSSEVVYLDPEFIEVFGIERCETTIRWGGERV